MSKHENHSTFREKIIEYGFIYNLLKKFWNDDDFRIQISRLDIDRGIDLICIVDEVNYLIQLKSKLATEKNSEKCRVDIDYAASKNANYILIVILVDENLNFDAFSYRIVDSEKIATRKLRKSKHKKADAKGQKKIRKAKRSVTVKLEDGCTFDQIYQQISRK